jgi:hypothetical protein
MLPQLWECCLQLQKRHPLGQLMMCCLLDRAHDTPAGSDAPHKTPHAQYDSLSASKPQYSLHIMDVTRSA